MSIIVTALALAASAQAAPAAPAAPVDHNQHQQGAPKDQPAKECCCCEKMADGKKMACCEKHAPAEGGGHAGNSSH